MTESSARHPVDRAYGSLKITGTVDEAIDRMRGPRPRSQAGDDGGGSGLLQDGSQVVIDPSRRALRP